MAINTTVVRIQAERFSLSIFGLEREEVIAKYSPLAPKNVFIRKVSESYLAPPRYFKPKKKIEERFDPSKSNAPIPPTPQRRPVRARKNKKDLELVEYFK